MAPILGPYTLQSMLSYAVCPTTEANIEAIIRGSLAYVAII